MGSPLSWVELPGPTRRGSATEPRQASSRFPIKPSKMHAILGNSLALYPPIPYSKTSPKMHLSPALVSLPMFALPLFAAPIPDGGNGGNSFSGAGGNAAGGNVSGCGPSDDPGLDAIGLGLITASNGNGGSGGDAGSGNSFGGNGGDR